MEIIETIFGLHASTLSTGQMVARTIVVFFMALVFIRIAGMRTLGNQTAFDHLTLLVLGAILGRAIVSAQQPFFASFVAVLVLMLLRRAAAWVTFKSHAMGKIFKGSPIALIGDGKFIEENMAKTSITKDDLKESLRQSINSDDFTDVKTAYLERSGKISITKARKI